MERRLDARFPAHLEARVTDIATGDCASVSFLTNISESGACFTSPLQLSSAAVVKLEVADSVIFGHVIHSTAEGASFRTGMEIVQVLLGGTDLSLNAVLVEAALTAGR